MRVLFIQQVAPLIVFCAPFCCPFRADKHQRQAAMVAV
ncbi:rhsC domain protein, partial [Shigella boydii 965-58]